MSDHIFNGRHDETVSSKVTAAWFARVHAPVKKLVWFEKSAHMMQIEEPGRMLMSTTCARSPERNRASQRARSLTRSRTLACAVAIARSSSSVEK
jgi:pimeloyl-ACP methyl ester carboxylesterase